ncbi:MAG TPA: hypothetical protein VFW11_06380 [Cyclobacteriaceae bacterium]|nr:hypothetical protein [Cyclobacteriaceae bacterium]
MKDLKAFLGGGDLRSTGKSHLLIKKIRNQHDFDELFRFIFSDDRLVAMRAADVIEKVTRKNPEYLLSYNNQIVSLMKGNGNKELRWHLAQLCPRLELKPKELATVWTLLRKQATRRDESKIVSVNCLQSLYDLVEKNEHLSDSFKEILLEVSANPSPAVQARIRKLKRNIR